MYRNLHFLHPEHQTVLLRTDYNVPLENGLIQNNLRIKKSLPTIQYLLDHQVKKLVIISHLGRPEGKVMPEFSLNPVAAELSLLLQREVFFAPETTGEATKQLISEAPEGAVILLENLRFHPGEEENSKDFAESIFDTVQPDCFVQDGFGVLHRSHASTDALPRLLPSAMGLLVEQEIENLKKVQENPLHPVLLIIGGAKVKDKSPLIEHFASLSDYIYVGGKIAADGFTSDLPQITIASDFNEDESGAKLDIGPKSLDQLIDLVLKSRTIIWNGTLGLTEKPPFDFASRVIAESIGVKNPAENLSVICGGDTTGFVENLLQNRYSDQPPLNFSLVSTGGGASLEFLIHGTLPGLEVLKTVWSKNHASVNFAIITWTCLGAENN